MKETLALGWENMALTALSEDRDRHKSDVRLVQRFAQGDSASAYEIFDSYCDRLVRFVLRRTGFSIEDAEDVVNETFVSALRLGNTYDGTCSIFTWLCCLARYRIADEIRRSHAKNRVPAERQISLDDDARDAIRGIFDPHASVEAILDQIDCHMLANHLLNILSPDQREAVVTRYVDGFSVEETATILGKSTKAIEKLVERAKDVHRKALSNSPHYQRGQSPFGIQL